MLRFLRPLLCHLVLGALGEDGTAGEQTVSAAVQEECDGAETVLELLQMRGRARDLGREHAEVGVNSSLHGLEDAEGLTNAATCNFVYCPHHSHDRRCEHYRKCVQSRRRRRGRDVIFRNKHYCSLFHGYLTDPIVKFSGSEEIQDGWHRADDWDWIWDAAKKGGCMLDGQGLQVGCALLCNPKCKRGQDQFHIHNKPLSTDGRMLQGYLRENVCSGEGWLQIPSSASYCRSRTKTYAKFFSSFPAVFSSVEDSGYFRERGGITVWPVSQEYGCHESGYVLMLSNCNIEKDIFPESLR
ncbi:SEC14 [Symbiodinium sp. CCMP2592]|nr:SEC14 [Symbiodinium sp. CCMP2592]